MIYFDAAATTLQKPEQVPRAAFHAMTRMSSPGRGGYSAARNAEETAYRCRAEAATLFGVRNPENVIFTHSATHGLNIAIRSLVHPGSRVVISGYEHNAVTRTLHDIPNITVAVVDSPLFRADKAVEGFEREIAHGTDVVICNHISNVFGYILPIQQIACVCTKHKVPLIVDASQSAGIVPVRQDELGAAFIAMPGHKGLYGPQGTGLLLCAEGPTQPVLYGGTGSNSRVQMMPQELPDRLEAGTHNMPGIAGLLAGIQFVKKTGVERIGAHEKSLVKLTCDLLCQIPGIRAFSAGITRDCQASVLSFIAEGKEGERLAEILSQHGVAVRAGLHCAPLAHQTAGTLESGTVRVSFSFFNRPAQIRKFALLLAHLLRDNVAL